MWPDPGRRRPAARNITVSRDGETQHGRAPVASLRVPRRARRSLTSPSPAPPAVGPQFPRSRRGKPERHRSYTGEEAARVARFRQTTKEKALAVQGRSAAPEDHSPGAPRGWLRENFREPMEGLRPPAPGPWTPPGHEGPGLPRYVFSPGDTPGIAGQPWNCLEPASSRLHESPFCAGGSGPPPTER